MSGRHTWDWTQAYLATNYGYGVPVAAFSLHWMDPLATQSAELIQDVSAQGSPLAGRFVGQYVFVGHSQGGLIARSVYQYVSTGIGVEKYHYPLAGVVTIGSPALGAPIANSVQGIARTMLSTFSGLREQYCPPGNSDPRVADAGACYVAIRAGAFAEGPLQGLAQSRSVSDLKAGSTFLVGLSAGREPFHRANIVSYADPRWVFWRLSAESVVSCAPADLTCNGDGLVKSITNAYAKLQACVRLSVALRLGSWGAGCAATAKALDQLDLTWSKLTTGPWDPTKTDGIVPGESQASDGRGLCASNCGPTVTQHYVAHGPSHVGETSNYRVYEQLQGVLDAEYRVGWHQ